MRSYTSDEKKFLRMIAHKTINTEQFFQLLASEHFFKKDYRPFMLVNGDKKQVILFFGHGEKHRQFPRFLSLVALMEDLVEDRLIVRVPVEQGNYFTGEFYDAKEEEIENGNKRYTSKSTGRYIETPNIHELYDNSGNLIERLDGVIFDDPDHYERFSKAFSGIVYPREALKDLVENKFLSVEQRRHRHTMIAAWTAITISLLFSLLSLF